MLRCRCEDGVCWWPGRWPCAALEERALVDAGVLDAREERDPMEPPDFLRRALTPKSPRPVAKAGAVC